MKIQLITYLQQVLVICLTGCYTTNLPNINSQKIPDNVYEFQNPRFSFTSTYTGVSAFCASIIGITAYNSTNPWYSLESKKSPVASAVVGVSGVFITTALIKGIFYLNKVNEGEEQNVWMILIVI